MKHVIEMVRRLRAYPPILGATAGFVAGTALYVVVTAWWLIAGNEFSGGWPAHVVAIAIQLVGWSLSGWFVGVVAMWVIRARRPAQR